MCQRLACRAAELFAHPVAIVLLPVLCSVWLLVGGSMDGLTLGLSITALSLTQLVLLAQAKDTRAMQSKLDGLIAGTDADDALAGIEQQG